MQVHSDLDYIDVLEGGYTESLKCVVHDDAIGLGIHPEGAQKLLPQLHLPTSKQY